MQQKAEKTLRLILGDQLNLSHSWFQKVDESVTYVLMEVRSETDYAVHHIQKVIGFFAAMQYFAESLSIQGHQVIYIKLNDVANLQSFDKNCAALISNLAFTKFEYQLPDEYRLDQHLKLFVDRKITHSPDRSGILFFCSKKDRTKSRNSSIEYAVRNHFGADSSLKI